MTFQRKAETFSLRKFISIHFLSLSLSPPHFISFFSQMWCNIYLLFSCAFFFFSVCALSHFHLSPFPLPSKNLPLCSFSLSPSLMTHFLPHPPSNFCWLFLVSPPSLCVSPLAFLSYSLHLFLYLEQSQREQLLYPQTTCTTNQSPKKAKEISLCEAHQHINPISSTNPQYPIQCMAGHSHKPSSIKAKPSKRCHVQCYNEISAHQKLWMVAIYDNFQPRSIIITYSMFNDQVSEMVIGCAPSTHFCLYTRHQV